MSVPLWQAGAVSQELDGIRPRMESWNAKSDREQARLREFLLEVESGLGPLPEGPLFLHLEVDVQEPQRLLERDNLESYLTPLIRHLGPGHFRLVSASKRVGGGSRLTLGQAVPAATGPDWNQARVSLTGSPTSTEWKVRLREALKDCPQMPPGPVHVTLAWRSSPRRSWLSLWKPTGDALGPLLGEPLANRPYYPNDDRIVELANHWIPDPAIGNDVEILVCWRAAQGQGHSPLVRLEIAITDAPPQVGAAGDGGLIDGILEVARGIGADRQPFRLSELREAYARRFPEKTAQEPFDALIDFHCISMASRFPNRRDPREPAPWLTRPVFKRVNLGVYQLLSPQELAWFAAAVEKKDPLIYKNDYQVPKT